MILGLQTLTTAGRIQPSFL